MSQQEDNRMLQRDRFTSRAGFILASAGSAIGLGNIWRFPYTAGMNGGGAFLFVYLFFVVFVATALLLVEFVIGRHGRSNAVECYRKLSPRFAWVGYLGVLTSFLLLAFYSVVGGWTIRYALLACLGRFGGIAPEGAGAVFGNFISGVGSPIGYLFLFMGATAFIIAQGVASGIERYSKILMPVLFVLLVALVLRSVTLPGAREGLRWFLQPDFSKITLGVVVSALAQSFFSLSVGISSMTTYASYLGKEENLIQAAFWVSLCDTAIACMAGFVIFPAVFAFSMEPAAGPGLVFITLPTVFGAMPAGNIFAGAFFVLLVIAALTSSINMMEVAVSFFSERSGRDRRKVAAAYGMICFVIAIPASLSFGAWKKVTFLGKTIFDCYDYFVSNIALSLSALMCALLVGWVWKKGAMEELSNNGTIRSAYVPFWFWTVRYVSPWAVGIIWLESVGLLRPLAALVGISF